MAGGIVVGVGVSWAWSHFGGSEMIGDFADNLFHYDDPPPGREPDR